MVPLQQDHLVVCKTCGKATIEFTPVSSEGRNTLSGWHRVF